MEWTFAQRDPSERLARIHLFSMKKVQDGVEIDFTITVQEFLTPEDPAVQFFAKADKQTNQKMAPFTPCGWGRTLLEALSSCMQAIHKFPYQGPEIG